MKQQNFSKRSLDISTDRHEEVKEEEGSSIYLSTAERIGKHKD